MTDFARKVVSHRETRKGAGTYVLSCGHQVHATDDEWSKWKKKFECVECRRNAAHEAEAEA